VDVDLNVDLDEIFDKKILRIRDNDVNAQKIVK